MAGGASSVGRSLRGALPSLSAKTVTGLSIEGGDLRLICVSGREITRIVNRPLPPDTLSGGVVVNSAAFGAATRAILDEYELPRGTIVAGYPDMDAIARQMTLPKEAGARIADVVQREARRDPIIGSGAYRVYHQTIGQTKDHINVFVLAVRGAALDRYLAGLRHAAIAPQLVELRPLAMIRAVGQYETIIAHIERTALDLVVVNNFMPAIMRSVPLPETGDEAGLVETVVVELGRTIEAYNNDRPQPLSADMPVALTGELSALPAIQTAIQERIGHPIAQVTCPYTAPAGFAVANFVVNIGLVMKAR